MATSRPARQTYLNTLLLMITSAVLLGIAALSYVLFYMNFVPSVGIERTVHLQFGNGPNPYGFINLESALIPQQPYSVHLTLSLPRSPPNLAAGNFMLDLSLLSPSYIPESRDLTMPMARSSIPTEAILFSSRRPSILTYHSDLVNLSKEIAALPWFLFGFKRDEEKLEITMAESVTFAKGWRNVPKWVYLELQARGPDIQIYSVQLTLRAKFGGLRWIMYNHRIFSFLFFTGAFWSAELFFALAAWLMWTSHSTDRDPGQKERKGDDRDVDGSKAIKDEEREEGATETDDLDLSDTPRSFPTYGRQAPLRYVPKVKAEDSDEIALDETAIQPLAAEADDESEEPLDIGAGFRAGRSDSGIGTSFSEGGEGSRSAFLRRKSRGGKGSG
ncbi:MAG: hypothetical protein M1818_005194 [Claussenomyces sp. TS43310]|nr:MAG: hypothetical protein M1818_005194 [Claussenomyces sp. TS43310]